MPDMSKPKTCPCGSGKLRAAQYDGRGIFLTCTCEACYDRKMARYRPEVLTDPSYWTADAIRYAFNHWDGLTRSLDGRLLRPYARPR
jgi:hypothetical protein